MPGPECGRCLKACPGDVIQHWLRLAGLRPLPLAARLAQLADHLTNIFDAGAIRKPRNTMVRSETSFNLWQSILRGSGVITGCRRCEDVCPVGTDYEMLRDAVDQIPEDTPAKETKREAMVAAESAGKLR